MIKISSTQNKQLDDLIKSLKQPNKLLEEIGQILQGSVQERIVKSKEDPEGKKWAPWSFATHRARIKDGDESKGLLYKSGKLRDSIKYELSDTRVIVGSDETAPYAEYLNDGTNKMPARPFIGISKKDETAITKAIKGYIAK